MNCLEGAHQGEMTCYMQAFVIWSPGHQNERKILEALLTRTDATISFLLKMSVDTESISS